MARSNRRIVLIAFLGLVIAAVAFYWLLGRWRNPEEPKTLECRTQAPSLEVQQTINRLAEKRRDQTPAPRAAGSVTIPVYFHIITNTSGSEGNLTDAQVNDQIAVLNAAFSGTSPGGTGANTPFRFSLTGIDRTAKDDWFNMSYSPTTPSEEEIVAKAMLKRGDKSTLNIYSVKPAGGSLGWARWPWDVATAGCVDGVVIRFSTVPGISSSSSSGQGDTATHEVGHWLGLFHTYEGFACTGIGDSVDDTPFQMSPGAGAASCTIVDSCPAVLGGDPIENFMSRAMDSCMFQFTPGQSNRMDVMHLLYRT